jgi:hypothetical protein
LGGGGSLPTQFQETIFLIEEGKGRLETENWRKQNLSTCRHKFFVRNVDLPSYREEKSREREREREERERVTGGGGGKRTKTR